MKISVFFSTILILCNFAINAKGQSTSRKSIFLTLEEKLRLQNISSTSPTAALLSAMQMRVQKRAMSPGLNDLSATTEWWHHVGEYLTDAALIHAVRPSPDVDIWLRAVVMDVTRKSVADWAGPWFRNYTGGNMTGSLETGHLAWGLAIAYDLSHDLFSESEKVEILSALRDKGMIPCKRYLDKSKSMMNWNCVLYAGFTVSAAVLGDVQALKEAEKWLPIIKDHFQKDGSYGESLQYANYAASSIMLAQEAMIRFSPEKQISLDPYGKMVDWASQAFLYRKPLSGWPLMDWARSVNFGDAAAIFRPSGDLLVHIAVRAKREMPNEAGLASWMFNNLYFPANEPGPHDLASFGFINGFGFLSVIMLADAAAPLSPKELNSPTVKVFSGGDAFARDELNGVTTLAVKMPSEPRHAAAHLHGDVNSFILVHNKERLLVDPGHSCYRNSNHDYETSSFSHNTCTFEVPATPTSPARVLTQKGDFRRQLIQRNDSIIAGAPVDFGGKRHIATKVGSVSVIGADAAAMYGSPLKTFSRFFVMCGSYALFMIDVIEADQPIKTTWNFILNNRDGLLNLKVNKPQNVTAIKGEAGVKINHYGTGNIQGPQYGFVHDAYHPLPAQLGEGKPGSGMVMRWTEPEASSKRTVVHTMATDNQAAIAGWKSSSLNNTYTLEDSDRKQKWTLTVKQDGSFLIEDIVSAKSYILKMKDGASWSLDSGI
jgi:hypothetical protein